VTCTSVDDDSRLHSRAELGRLLDRARTDAGQSLGQLLELYRNYLKMLALTQMDRQIQVRCSPSDVVQETFLEAHRDFAQFQGQGEGQFLAWLRKILANNLAHVFEKHVHAQRRSVRRELRLDGIGASLERSTARLHAVLVGREDSPSAQTREQEWAVILADHLADLPADYRDVLVLRHLRGLPFKEVAEQMDRTPGAVRMLWVRAIAEIRQRLNAKGLI
jgi:RNA polymerase sigma-70 factor (ECF subfamily)